MGSNMGSNMGEDVNLHINEREMMGGLWLDNT